MKTGTPICVIATVCILAGPANALEVSNFATVAETPDAVWQRIGEFCSIQDWHPAVSKCVQADEGGAT